MGQGVEEICNTTTFKRTGHVRFTFSLANAGSQTAIVVAAHLTVGSGSVFSGPGAKVSVIPPAYDAVSQMIPKVQIEVERTQFDNAIESLPQQDGVYTVRLVVTYRTAGGHKFADVTYVTLRYENQIYVFVDSPVYVGKFIEGYETFSLTTPCEQAETRR